MMSLDALDALPQLQQTGLGHIPVLVLDATPHQCPCEGFFSWANLKIFCHSAEVIHDSIAYNCLGSKCLLKGPGGVQGPRGVLNFGLGRGVPLGFLKCHPSMYPFWRKSDPSMYQKSKFFAEICAILAQISENFKKLTNQTTKFAPFWSKF